MTESKPIAPPPAIQEISAALLKRRQDRKLKLEEISQILKIRVPLLKALEEGQWDQVPGGIYLDNFLKKYCQYLGLEYDKLVQTYAKEKAEAPAGPTPVKSTPLNDDPKSSRTIWVSLAVGCGILIILIKFMLSLSHEKSLVESKPATPVASAATEPPPVAPVKNATPHTIKIFTIYPLWLRVDSEDRPFEGFIPENSTWTWTAKGPVAVRLGHTKEIKLTMDGQQVPIAENQKVVKSADAN